MVVNSFANFLLDPGTEYKIKNRNFGYYLKGSNEIVNLKISQGYRIKKH